MTLLIPLLFWCSIITGICLVCVIHYFGKACRLHRSKRWGRVRRDQTWSRLLVDRPKEILFDVYAELLKRWGFVLDEDEPNPAGTKDAETGGAAPLNEAQEPLVSGRY